MHLRKDLSRVVCTISDQIFRAQHANDRLVHLGNGVEVAKMAYTRLLLHSKVYGVKPFVSHDGNVRSSIEEDQEGVSLEPTDLDHTAVDDFLVR